MFWKLRDKLASFNLAKFKRDAYIEAQRLQYRSNQLQRDIYKEIKRQSPKVTKAWKELSAYKPQVDSRQFSKMGLRSLDGKWANLRDAWVERMEAGGRMALGLAVQLWNWVNMSKTVKTTTTLGKSVLRDSKNFLFENLQYSRKHVSAYFQANQHFFDYYKRKYWTFTPTSKRRLVLFGTAAGLLYAVGVLAKRQSSVESRP